MEFNSSFKILSLPFQLSQRSTPSRKNVAKAFKNSPLQYARLHDIQLETYKKRYAIVLAVITRWGTELGLYDGLVRSKEALQKYALRWNDPKDMPANILNTLRSAEFWENLNIIREILRPITEHLKMSESNKPTLGMVLPCWNAIFTHLEDMKTLHPTLGFEEFLSGERDQYGKPE